jgi:Tfp pilus assembly protein PilF
VELSAIPLPDLSLAEPDVRETLAEARANLAEASRSSGITAHELADAYGTTGTYYLAYRIWEAAEPSLANAARLAPEDYRWPYYLGYRFEQDSRLDRAAARYEQALALRPGFLPAQVRLGRVYLELGQPERAVPLLEPAAGDPGLRAAALLGLGRAALAGGNPAAAVAHLEAALTESPDASRVHYPLAMAYRALGKVDEARSHLARRGDGEPRLPDPLIDDLTVLLSGSRTQFYRGIEAMRAGQFPVAAEAFARGLVRQPGNANARVTLARALYLSGDRAGARRELDAVLAADGSNELARFLRGTLYEEEGDPGAAEQAYRETLRVRPEHGGASHFLANLLMRGGQYAEAARHYAAAARAVPGNAPARLYEALALVRASADHRAARERLERSVAEMPDDALLRQALARVLAASPDDRVRDGARALTLAQALFDSFGSLEHAEALAMALAETGRLEDAAALQQDALAAAEAAGRYDLLARVGESLERYRRGQPSRRPWSAFDPLFFPNPAGARGAFLEYPTLAAY